MVSYLKVQLFGCIINSQGGCQDKIRRRRAIARTAMANLNQIWSDRNVTKATKIKLVQTLVFPIAIYASESWTINKADQNIVNAFELWTGAEGDC